MVKGSLSGLFVGPGGILKVVLLYIALNLTVMFLVFTAGASRSVRSKGEFSQFKDSHI